MCDNRLKRKYGNVQNNAAQKMNRNRNLAAMQRQSRQSPAASSSQDNTGDMEMEEIKDHIPGHIDVNELTTLATSWYKHLSSGGLSNKELVEKCRFEAFVLDTDLLLQKQAPAREFDDDGDETTQSQARRQQWSEFKVAMSRFESNMRVQYGEVRNSPTYLLWKRPELLHGRLRLLHFDKQKVRAV